MSSRRETLKSNAFAARRSAASVASLELTPSVHRKFANVSATNFVRGAVRLDPHGLIDTGALLALLDRDDKWHVACVESFARVRLPVATSAAVLAELFHLLGDGKRELTAAWRLLRSGAIAVVPIGDPDLAELQALMERYSDRPMDFADATLVHLARKLKVVDVLTVDHDDFETYRIDGKRAFRVLPTRMRARGKR